MPETGRATRRSLVPATLLIAACLLVAGCGAEETSRQGPESPRRAASPRIETPLRTTVYFLTDDGTALLGARRDLARRDGTGTARLALEELLAGPTSAERRSGVTTAVPTEATIRSLTIERRAAGSDAFVDLSGLPSADDSGAVQRVRVMTQVARTLIGLGDIERVWLRVDGRSWGLWDMEGNIRDDPIDYDRLRGFFHVCAAKPGTEAVPGDCFTALP